LLISIGLCAQSEIGNLKSKIHMTGIALIGYGAMGRAHAMAYRDIGFHYGLPANAIKLIGVATTREETAYKAAAEIGCDTAVTNYRLLLDRDDVDVIDICTPHDSHADILIAAAQAGRHIYCEKPLARTLNEAERAAAAVREAGIKLGLTFNFRFFPCVLRAKQLIDEGFVGRVFSFHGRYFRASYIDPQRPMAWRLRKAQAGGGIVIDSGAHLIDLTHFLLGDVAEVRATLDTPHKQRPKTKDSSEMEAVDVEDMAFAQLRLPSGALGTWEMSRVATGATNDIWFEVRGDAGALRFALEEPNWLYVYDQRGGEGARGFTRVETVGRYPGQLAPDWTAPVGVARAHAECQYQFLKAIWDEREPSPGLEDGLRAQRTIEAVYQSDESESWIDV
jgi:predicted dehydrogenase